MSGGVNLVIKKSTTVAKCILIQVSIQSSQNSIILDQRFQIKSNVSFALNISNKNIYVFALISSLEYFSGWYFKFLRTTHFDCIYAFHWNVQFVLISNLIFEARKQSESVFSSDLFSIITVFVCYQHNIEQIFDTTNVEIGIKCHSLWPSTMNAQAL